MQSNSSIGQLDNQPPGEADQINGLVLAICTDASRCGSSLYNGITVHLVADRKDPSDPFKGLDLLIQRSDPQVVIVSGVQTRLITFLEKRFRMLVVDIAHRRGTMADIKTLTNATISDPNAINIGARSLELTTSGSQVTSVEANQIMTSRHMEAESEDLIQNNNGLESIDNLIGRVELEDYSFKLIIVPNSWFSLSSGYEQLVESELVNNMKFETQEEKMLFVATKVDRALDVCAIRAIGAIRAYSNLTQTANLMNTQCVDTQERPISGTQATTSASGTQESSQINATTQSRGAVSKFKKATVIQKIMPLYDIRYMDAGPILSVDRFTLESLSILSSSRRRNNIADDNMDPDLENVPTLYELLNQCSSPQGKRQMRTIMLWPLQDLSQIQNRLNFVEYFMNIEQNQLRELLCIQLKNVIPIQKILSRMSNSLVDYKSLGSVYKCLSSFVGIIDIIKDKGPTHIDILTRIANYDSTVLKSMMESIIGMIDFEGSRREGRTQVCYGVDEKVDSKKDIVDNMAKFCNDAALKETGKYKNQLGKLLQVIYVPRIGFLASAGLNSLSEFLDLQSNPEFDIMLHTEVAVYFKTPGMLELDKAAGDIACDLIDVQQDILVALQERVMKFADVMLELTELCGELDCLISFAIVSQQRHFTRPELVENNQELMIDQGFHPLHSIRANIVPNDVRFVKPTSFCPLKVMIITGPNCCGKTTYMKTTCLIIYMTHIGCFVPATYAKIPIFDSILTRMSSASSITTGLSSFASDLHQIQYAISRATERSIIAIDEFGRGTKAWDGYHLLKGVIMYYAKRGLKSPYVMVASHFTRLVDHLERYSEYILYKTFLVTRNVQRNSIQYNFKLIDGIGEHTLADEVAARAGLHQTLINRAREIRESMSENRIVGPRNYAPLAA